MKTQDQMMTEPGRDAAGLSRAFLFAAQVRSWFSRAGGFARASTPLRVPAMCPPPFTLIGEAAR